jgi:hypothetical protein
VNERGDCITRAVSSTVLMPPDHVVWRLSSTSTHIEWLRVLLGSLGQNVELLRHCWIDDVGGQIQAAAAIKLVG